MRRLMAALAASLAMFAAPAAAQNHHIGAVLPNSGPMTSFGELFRNGADLAAEHINADKMLSKPFVINHEDSQGAPQPARHATQRHHRYSAELVARARAPVAGQHRYHRHR